MNAVKGGLRYCKDHLSVIIGFRIVEIALFLDGLYMYPLDRVAVKTVYGDDRLGGLGVVIEHYGGFCFSGIEAETLKAL